MIKMIMMNFNGFWVKKIYKYMSDDGIMTMNMLENIYNMYEFQNEGITKFFL